MEKTIQQWLQENLTPEQFENAKKYRKDYISWDKKVNFLWQALLSGFWRHKMPEGFEYWMDKIEQL